MLFEVFFRPHILSLVFYLLKNVLVLLFDLLSEEFVLAFFGNFTTDQTQGFTFVNFLHFPYKRSVLQYDRVYLFSTGVSGLFVLGYLKGVLLTFLIIDGLFETCMQAVSIWIFDCVFMVFEPAFGDFLVDWVIYD